jgi:hypothetical protein
VTPGRRRGPATAGKSERSRRTIWCLGAQRGAAQCIVRRLDRGDRAVGVHGDGHGGKLVPAPLEDVEGVGVLDPRLLERLEADRQAPDEAGLDVVPGARQALRELAVALDRGDLALDLDPGVLGPWRSVTQPIGSWLSCCQRKGIGRTNSAPLGSTMSPPRSVFGVLAMPEKRACPTRTTRRPSAQASNTRESACRRLPCFVIPAARFSHEEEGNPRFSGGRIQCHQRNCVKSCHQRVDLCAS